MRARALVVLIASCGGGGGGAPDADPASPVVPVACAAPDATITTAGFAYSPMSVTIQVDQVVQFSPMTGHDVASTTTDAPFAVAFGGTGCFRFTRTGTYTFRCTPHAFTGSVIVQ